MLSRLSRLSAVRRLPRAFAVRNYSDGRSQGSVAQSPGSFKKKENALEGQYIHERELEKIKKLKADIDARNAELEEKKALLDSLEKGENGPEEETKK